MAIRKGSILPKIINMETLDNPIEETCNWIVNVVAGINKPRNKPVLKRRIEEFFPFTPPSLFHTAFTKVVEDGKIKETKIGIGSSTGFLVAENN